MNTIGQFWNSSKHDKAQLYAGRRPTLLGGVPISSTGGLALLPA